ncbi:hypothetical protein L484_005724 [Morus notabilis]|uniref:SCP domain-containing protein n=2 Tax=Morus notabilis TaxID=981085 RepID=W9QBP0_9ROSA|nr:hypothetical protein L484_005724 [Morus notabilis]
MANQNKQTLNKSHVPFPPILPLLSDDDESSQSHQHQHQLMPSSAHSLLFVISLIVLLVVVPTSAHLHDSQNVTAPHVHVRLGGRFFRHVRRHMALSRQFVHAHNTVRRQLNQPLLTWDRGLARYARRSASRRFFDCKMVHSYGPYGENIFWGGRDHWTAAEAVESWIREAQFYNPDTNECTPGEMCGHYTQVVWRDTLRVGCARMRCLNGGLLVFCEYDPPGNYINENPFGKVFDDILDPPATSDSPFENLT